MAVLGWFLGVGGTGLRGLLVFANRPKYEHLLVFQHRDAQGGFLNVFWYLNALKKHRLRGQDDLIFTWVLDGLGIFNYCWMCVVGYCVK